MRGVAATAILVVLLGIAAGCRQAIVHVPVSPEDVVHANQASQEGDLAFARKEYYAALIKFLEGARFNPNSEHIFNKIGITWSRLHYYTDALEAFRRSIGLNPKYPYPYNNMGSVYFATGNKKKAESNFRKAIGLKNDEASFHMNLGTLYFENKKYEKGLREWREGLSLDPEILNQSAGLNVAAESSQKSNAEKNYFVARLYASMGNVDRAVESLQQALSTGFTDMESLRTEKDFDPIRHEEKFIAFMKYAAQIIKN